MTATHITPAPILTGIDVPPGRLEQVAVALGAVVGNDEQPGGALIVVSPIGEAETVRTSFARGASCFLQLGEQDAPPVLPDREQGLDRRLVIGLTTGSAFALDIAVLLCDALMDRAVLGSARRHEVELAVHEAVSNAIVHGNLAIRRGPEMDAASFERFYADVQAALSRPGIAARRILLDARWDSSHLTVSISDEGTGFDTQSLLAAEPEAKSGRGLQIIREIADDVAFAENGRRIFLKFRR